MTITGVDLTQLRYLDALAIERHFGRAAARCHVSQPALSSAIRRLEEELGVRLIDRTQRFEGLTHEGDVLVRRARETLAAADALETEAAALRGDLTGVLRLRTIPTGAAAIGPLLAAFTATHGGASVSLSTGRADEILEAVLRRDLDAGVLYIDDPLPAGLRAQPLQRDELVLLTSDARLAGTSDPIRWAELEGVALGLLAPSMQNRQLIDRTLEHAGVAPTVRVEVDAVAALVALGVAGGSCIVSRAWLRERRLPASASIRPLVEPEVAPMLGVVTLAGATGTPRGRALAALAVPAA